MLTAHYKSNKQIKFHHDQLSICRFMATHKSANRQSDMPYKVKF